VGTSLKTKPIYEFGDYRLDAEERVLIREGQNVPIPPKDIETLVVLVEKAGHIVGKDELLAKVWPGVFIEENNLARRIFNLRQVLGEGPDGRKYIETVPKRGYRFVGSVRERGDSLESSAPMPTTSDSPRPDARAIHRRSIWTWALAAVLVGTAILLVHHFWPTRASSSQKVMLAVLPFENLSRDASEDYFSDGLTEEMIAQLGQVQPSRLGVIARTSAMRYKNSKESIAQIGHELGVNYLLEGSVRHAGLRVRITAQLIQTNDQTHLWSESYETPLTDILKIQREIAERITQSLRLELLPARSHTTEVPIQPEAYRKYLLGLNEFRKGTGEGFQSAIRDFQDAIAIDPRSARLYAALAEVYSESVPYYSSPSVAMPLAKQAAQKAIELDPNLASAHATLGDIHLLFDWDWKAAEAEYRTALEINPNSSQAQLGYTDYLSTLGRHDEAISHAEIVNHVDPLALDSRNEALWAYYFSGRLQETVEQARKAIELEPEAGLPYAMMALAAADLGQRAEAARAAEKAAQSGESMRNNVCATNCSPTILATAASALARAGQHDRAKQVLEHALELAKTRYVCSFLVAAAYTDLGKTEQAFDSLDLAFRQRST
jgi:TolB-like protein/DNA-binding winged helix-turn-helix (wHTH) protein/Tfp pilus assembly protein PilF